MIEIVVWIARIKNAMCGAVNLIFTVGFIEYIKRDQGWFAVSRLLVASCPALDLLPCAKHNLLPWW
jgi:hypothetical protein